MSNEFDVVVIGAGPGGYVAAIRASQLKLKTAIIEREHLGGICLNWGCIPTKALLKTSEIYHSIKNAEQYGITCKNVSVDFGKVVARSREVAQKLSQGIKGLMKKNNITVLDGHGKLLGTNKVSITNGSKTEEIKAKHIIIATGARAREVEGLKPDGKNIWTYKEAMVPKELPKSLLVVGSGAIGIEFASFYNMFGVDVTVVEISSRILMAEDEEIAATAHKSFEKRGIKIITNTQVKEAKAEKNGVTVTLLNKDGKSTKASFDKVISAVGIVANVENIGLEKTKIKLEKGFIKTDAFMHTDEPSIYAIGDVTSPPWLAHKASHEAVLCVEKIAGLKGHPIKRENIPGCTYCYPQIASVGLSEAKAKELGRKIKVGKFPFFANGKAIALGETEGFIKTIFDEKTGELLGAHMIGPEVTEMIQSLALAKTAELTEAELMHNIFPHPTLSEAIHESVLDAYKKVLHI
jgi:dihydrolipoamide dehydrogenase